MMLLAQFSGPVNYYVSAGTLVLVLLAHGVLSIAMTMVIGRRIHPDSSGRRWFVFLLFLTVFCIPLIGYLLVAAIYYWMRKYPPVAEHSFQDISAIMPSMFEQRSHTGRIAFAGAGIRYQLNTKKVASDEKLKVLNSVVAMPGHFAVPILKRSMQDSAEDVRLVSHGMLDQREKEINEDIALSQDILAAADDWAVRHEALRHLAMRYWDLVYFGLAEGEMLRFVYDQIEHYAQRALESDPSDGEVLMVLGKLRLHQRQPGAAEDCFRRAEELGVPPSRVLLYRAEAAFYRKDFALVRELLSGRQAFPNPGHLLPVLAFWRAGRPS